MIITEAQRAAIDELEREFEDCTGNDYHAIATGQAIVTMWFEVDGSDGSRVEREFTIYPGGRVVGDDVTERAEVRFLRSPLPHPRQRRGGAMYAQEQYPYDSAQFPAAPSESARPSAPRWPSIDAWTREINRVTCDPGFAAIIAAHAGREAPEFEEAI